MQNTSECSWTDLNYQLLMRALFLPSSSTISSSLSTSLVKDASLNAVVATLNSCSKCTNWIRSNLHKYSIFSVTYKSVENVLKID